MAPSFLSKLVKSPTHIRGSSERSLSPNSRRSPSPSGRSRTLSALGPNGAHARASSELASPNNSNLSVKRASRAPSTDNVSDSSSINPNFTIVPPSPRSKDVTGLPTNGTDDANHSAVDGLPASTSSGDAVNGNSVAQHRRTTSSPASSAERKSHFPPPSSSKKSKSRPTTPTSSTPSLHDITPSASSVIPPVPSLPAASTNNTLLPSPDMQMRKQPSNKSLKLSTNGSPNVPTAILPPAHPHAHPDVDDMTPIVESPTSELGLYDLQTATPGNTNANGQSAAGASTITGTSYLTASPPRDSDAASIRTTATRNSNASPPSAAKKKESSKPWRRQTSKPTGLASAIAASGLAMANPAFSAPHQLSPPAMSPVSRSGTSSSRKTSLTNAAPYMMRAGSTSVGTSSSTQFSPPRSSKSRRSSVGSGRRKHRPSLSVASDGTSEYLVDPGADYYSGLEDDSDEDEDDSEDDDDLGSAVDVHDMPVTGFAVASSRRNADFHELFRSIPEGDYLIEDYGCALQREILIQGRIYISENHICFHANILGWITDLSIPIDEIISLEKKMTAFVIPNAILITTRQAKYSFASFLSRDTTFDVIYNIWRLVRPGSDNASVGSGSMERGISQIVEGTIIGGAGGVNGEGELVAGPNAENKQTQCACGTAGKHYSETAMNTVIPGTPEKIHNLMFASGFIKDFLAVNQKLLDLQISDWTPSEPGSKLLGRNMSYIKPLGGSVGPKQTKCEIRDEVEHLDLDNYISTLTTTRTPDVPSGGAFSVKTKTCITWASAISSRVVVTTQVEWTGRSFIKGLIEKGAIDGQKKYHSDLETAMREYITEHQTEFVPEGVTLDVVVAPPITDVSADGKPVVAGTGTDTRSAADRERERNARGLQWAWETFDGAFGVAKRSTMGALDLIGDAFAQSSSTPILYFIIVGLLFSNIWTWMRVPKDSATSSKRLKMFKDEREERERWIHGVVTALWDELAAGKSPLPVQGQSQPAATSVNPEEVLQEQTVNPTQLQDEVITLHATLDHVEERIQKIREMLNVARSLGELD